MSASTSTNGAICRLAAVALALAPAALAQVTFPNVTVTSTATSASPTATLPPADPVYNPGVGNMTLVGCYAEPNGARALSSMFVGGNQTVEACLDRAASLGATFAGLEYGQECWYGSRVHGGSRPRPLSECDFPCPGNTREFCGAGDRLLLYSVGGAVPPVDSDQPTQPAAIGNYTLHGCMTEGNGTRALSEQSFVDGGMTLEACATFCAAYKYFGVEYSQECYCGNVFNNGSVPAPAAECSQVCAGNGLQFCGAGNRLSAYGRA